jgi:hypothetical protein
MNEGDNNFSIIRNAEINRIGPRYLQPFGYHNFETVKVMEERGAREDDVWYRTNTPMWKRGEEYVHRYCNRRLRTGTHEQVFVFRFRTFVELAEKGCSMLSYEEGRDVFILETEGDHGTLMRMIDEWNIGHYTRGYVLPKATDMEALMYIKHCVRVLPMSQVHIFGFPEEWIAKHFPTPTPTPTTPTPVSEQNADDAAAEPAPANVPAQHRLKHTRRNHKRRKPLRQCV